MGSAPRLEVRTRAKARGVLTSWNSFQPLQIVVIFEEELSLGVLDANQSFSEELSAAKALALVEYVPAALWGPRQHYAPFNNGTYG